MKPHTRIRLVAFLLILLVVVPVFWIAALPEFDASQYRLYDTPSYRVDGKECKGYRMIGPASATNKELFAIAQVALRDDLYLHTLWFYTSLEEVDGDYTIAMITQDTRKQFKLWRDGQVVATAAARYSPFPAWVFWVPLCWSLFVIFGTIYLTSPKKDHTPYARRCAACERRRKWSETYSKEGLCLSCREDIPTPVFHTDEYRDPPINRKSPD